MRRYFLISIALPALAVFAISPATASQKPQAAAKQSFSIVSLSEQCTEESEDEVEEFVVYLYEDNEPCKMVVRVVGRGKSKSKITLQYLDENNKWKATSSKTTDTKGRATFTFDSKFLDQPGEQCFYGDRFSSRFSVAKVGKFKAFLSKQFETEYWSAEESQACTEEVSDDVDDVDETEE